MCLWGTGERGRHNSRPGPKGHGHSGLKRQECVGRELPVTGFRARCSDQERAEWVPCPEPLHPCSALPGQGKTDTWRTRRHQDSEEQWGHSSQTVFAINNFSFNCMMCVEMGRKEERNSQRKRHIWQKRNTLDECGSHVRV